MGYYTFEEAIFGWERMLGHLSYEEIPHQVREMTTELNAIRDRQLSWDSTIEQVNRDLDLGIDFDELDKAIMPETLTTDRWDGLNETKQGFQ